MLGNDHHGLAEGQNPIKKVVLRRGILGSLWLIAGLAAAALSWQTAPECVRALPGPGCDDRNGYCHNPRIFSPKSDCSLLAKDCMKTCGCCTESPEGWCPNKVPTLQNIIADNSQSLLLFFGFFTLFNVISYWQLCCSPSIAAKRKVVVIMFIATACVLLVLACLWVTYELTDCQNEFRGISDVLFVASACCCICALVGISLTVALIPSIAQYGALLANIAEQRRCGDPNILVLDVGADRARRFLAEEQQQGTGLTVQTSHNRCMLCLRVFLYLELLLLAVLLAIGVFFGVLKPFAASRGVCFAIGYFLIFAVLAIYARIRRSKAYLDHQKHRGEQQWLQELQGPQELLLFCNVPTAMQGNPESIAGNSVISLGKWRNFLFAQVPQVAAVPGAFTTTTHTRILNAEGQTGDVLEFKTVVHRLSPGLLRADVRAEAVARIPLEPQHVAQVRAWLQERRAIFEFETAPEVEMPESAP